MDLLVRRPLLTERDSPKKELQLTLEAAWKLIVEGSDKPAITLAQIRGLVDHARALAQRVGEVSRVRKEPELTAHERALGDAEPPMEGGGT
jgi:hypothetical protein